MLLRKSSDLKLFVTKDKSLICNPPYSHEDAKITEQTEEHLDRCLSVVAPENY